MGWFLSSKTNKAKGKSRGKKLTKKKASPLAGKGWDPGRTLANMWLISWTLLLSVGAGAWYFGESYLMDHVSEQHRGQRVTVELIDTPGWMDERLSDRLRREVELMVDADPFDRAALEQAAEALQRKPWVEQVQRVVRTGAGEIQVHAVYRRPTALIETREGYHLVDRHGVKLPIRYSAKGAEATGLVVIKGIAEPAPEDGHRWEGEDVPAALTMARLIERAEWGESILAVDVRNYGGRVSNGDPHIVLPTRYGGLLRWGRAIGEEQFYEPSYQVKLKHIERVRRQLPTICAGGGTVDVFRDTVQVRYAEAGQRNATADVRYTLTSD